MTVPRNFGTPDEESADRDQKKFDRKQAARSPEERKAALRGLMELVLGEEADEKKAEEENRRREDAAKILFEDYPGGKPDAGAS